MRKHYPDIPVSFSLGNYTFDVLNLVYEQFCRVIPSHTHGKGCYEIHYISEGCGSARINGISYEITPGTLYVTGPHVEHAQIPYPENPMCEYCIYFRISNHPENDFPKSEDAIISSAFAATPFWFGQDACQLRPLFLSLFRVLSYRPTGYLAEADALLRQIVIRLVRNYKKPAERNARLPLSDTSGHASVIIEEYFLYEYAHLSLEELSARLGVGIRQTERSIYALYGKTFLQKKKEARMSAAAILLEHTQKSITQLSEELGYSSVEHFSSAFKNYYHSSPTQYRRSHKAAP
ncbi:MAG: helix-turn-helix domain-containing protein [Marvinbryantia sp.]|jgi:AraC family 4-hydroxyphenylacetate 3-monooxygenase operon regulatory protein